MVGRKGNGEGDMGARLPGRDARRKLSVSVCKAAFDDAWGVYAKVWTLGEGMSGVYRSWVHGFGVARGMQVCGVRVRTWCIPARCWCLEESVWSLIGWDSGVWSMGAGTTRAWKKGESVIGERSIGIWLVVCVKVGGSTNADLRWISQYGYHSMQLSV